MERTGLLGKFRMQGGKVEQAAIDAAGRSASMHASLKQMIQIMTQMVCGEHL